MVNCEETKVQCKIYHRIYSSESVSCDFSPDVIYFQV